MKLHARSLLAAAVALASQGAWSADTYLTVFLDSSPMQGVEVKFNGRGLGFTDERGSSTAFTESGKHNIELYRAGTLLTSVNFKTDKDEDAEITVTFSKETDQPEVSVSKFDSDNKSASGFIGGVITDINGGAIANATISDIDGNTQAITNASGVYEIELPRGEYSLDVKHPKYASTSINNIRVLANLGVSASVRLSSKSISTINIAAPSVERPIEEVLVLGTYKSTNSAVSLEQFSANVVDVLDIAQLERLGDSNVAIALTRLAGVAVTGGKYANVRGLDGRYVSSALNGFLMPSTDPLRRDIQLDLFPSNILSGIEVQKSYSPDLLGSTTGGSLQISTKGLPSERVGSIKVKVGGNSEFTGDDIASYKGSNGDRLGYDSGMRALSDAVVDATNEGLALRIGDQPGAVSPLQAAAYALTFEDDYNVKSTTAVPDIEAAISFGDITDSGLFGYYGALNYSSGTDSRTDAELSDPLEVIGDYDRSKESVSINGYLVLGSQFRSEDEVLSKTIVLRDSDNVTRTESGIDNEDNSRDKVLLKFTERQFLSQQFEGKHVFDFSHASHELDWGIAFSNTDLYQPDRRSYEYLSGFLILNALERRWFDLSEDSLDFRIDYALPVDFSDSISTTFKLGALASEKERDVKQYRFGFSLGQGGGAADSITINDNLEDVFSYTQFVQDNYRLAPKTTGTDSFNAEENVSAYYINSETSIGERWTLLIGARQEQFDQQLKYPNQPSADSNVLDSDELLPSLGVNFAFNDEWQFRVAASQTVSYPGLIERSRGKFFDPETDEEIIGNPDLITSTIENIDFRIEYYFSKEESISLAFFNKEIENPVERSVLDGSGSTTDGYTFRQSDSATLNGIELDANFNMFETGSWLGFVGGNITYIDSEVTLSGRGLALEGVASQGRELQGQSPYLANLQFGFDHFPLEQKFTLLINYFDDRIFKVNRRPRGPEKEVARTTLNFNYEKLFGEALTVKAQFKNLLNEEIAYSIDGVVVESYKEGIKYAINASWEF